MTSVIPHQSNISTIQPTKREGLAAPANLPKNQSAIESSQESGKIMPHELEQQKKLNPENKDEVNKAVDQLNQLTQNIKRDLRFSVDESTGKAVIKVLDSESKEIIRQIPPEEILELVEKLADNGEGSLLKVKA